MIGSNQGTMTLGGRGRMAGLSIPYLPDPTTLIDIKTFEKSGVTRYLPSDRAVWRLAAAGLTSARNAKHKSSEYTGHPVS